MFGRGGFGSRYEEARFVFVPFARYGWVGLGADADGGLVRALVEQRLRTELVGERRAFLDGQIDVELANM